MLYIITCWPVCLKCPMPRHTRGSFYNEGLHCIILFSKLYLTSLYLGTLAAVKLEQLGNKILCKDIAKLSGVHQTFMALQSLVKHFAQKMYSYTFTGICAAYQVRSRQAGTIALHPLSHREWRGQIRHRLSRSIGAVPKARMMSSISVTLKLALCEILHCLAIDTLLVS